MSYKFKVTLQKKDRSFKGCKDSPALACIERFKALLGRQELRAYFIEERQEQPVFIKLHSTVREPGILERLLTRLMPGYEFSFFERPLCGTLRRAFATSMVGLFAIASFMGLSAKQVQASVEKSENLPDVQKLPRTLQKTMEFLPTDCPPIVRLTNCITTSQTFPAPQSLQHEFAQYSTHTNSHSNTTFSHTNTPAYHVNLTPGDSIF
ncbi:MAG: hypothetical protein RDV48_18690 [Candidatus Eremiobacteraeota bacterium]|nr:hypothetical protein [Candidatus Eremiobacteraeota bacterium]